MKFKLRIACVALLAVAATPVWALQLGQIQVKSALNQPLVAAIPLHPKNLVELDGLSVSLAPAADFARAGLQLTSTDQTLQFHVVTDNNGQKLILVTSSQPVTDPYLDFLLQINTRQGKQVREFVVLLNPVIAATAPEIQTAPVASPPAGNAQASPPPEQLPPSSAFPQPAPQTESRPATQPAPEQKVAAPKPKPAAPLPPKPAPVQKAATPKRAAPPAPKPAPAQKAATPKPAAPPPKPAPKPALPPAPPPQAPLHSGGTVTVAHGDTLYGIAREQTEATRISVNQMMLALKTANPDAFFRDNINDLKAGAILRIPTRDEIDKTGVAEAIAEVHRQYETWRTARPHPATVVEGTAVQAAANAAPKPGKAAPASDHLTLVPPTGEGGGVNNRPGVAGGTGSETVTGLQQKLQNDRGTLISLDQSNADLESRARSLKDITDKADKLLSLKDGTIAELQRKLAAMQSGKVAAGAASAATAAAAPVASQATVVASASATAAAKPGNQPAPQAGALSQPWYLHPLTWIVAGLIVLALILLGLLRKRRRGGAVAASAIAKGPLPDPEDVVPPPEAADDEAALQAKLVEDPGDLAAHLALCRWYHAQGDEPRFVAAAKAMRAHVVDPESAEWLEMMVMGEELAPHLPLFELPAKANDDPYSMAALHWRVGEHATDVQAPADVRAPTDMHAPVQHDPEPVHEPRYDKVRDKPRVSSMAAPEADPVVVALADPDTEFADDPVDTKLDLARAYLDMGDPVGARAMLDEVIEEGSQAQKDEAKRLLADVTS